MFLPQIKFICFDFDGVFTDGQFYMSSLGEQIKSYNGKDSFGLKILKDRGVKTAVLTAHDTPTWEHLIKVNHFNKLDLFKKGDQTKIEQLTAWKNQLNLNWSQIAYMGDDLSDLECLKAVGTSACPNDAVPEIKEVCHYVMKKDGGRGAVREFISYLINNGMI